MRAKEAKWALDRIEGFARPKIRHEQYKTPSELASLATHVMAVENGDIRGKKILDVGCGTGMLSAAAMVYGASSVVGIEIDSSLREVYTKNLLTVCDEGFSFIEADVLQAPPSSCIEFDTAVVNPPFGTKSNKGIDVCFLEYALSRARVVYSMHKTSTRAYFQAKYKGRIRVVSKMLFELPRTYSFHQKETKHIEVDLIRVESETA
ncbi:hypothetical protein NEDG_01047 [Nematocida displodere]|uniref:Methyltransferase small domain-containing protein n=1 Tax=Nematocida displodere TaxID=1805483 RepID=A0A177EAT8_9MICR|nr:hypothetical protein NEDG_01047 [Nematocida displodere]